MNLKIKDRLALNYLVATSILMAAVFSSIYFVVKEVVIFNIDRDLRYELNKHTEEVEVVDNKLSFINMEEWEEREHREVQVNPVFIQIVNVKGEIMGRSPNLKNDSLRFSDAHTSEFYNQLIGDQRVRTARIALKNRGAISGYILAAMSLESSITVLQKLQNILLVSFAVVLIVLFFFSRILAGRLIRPIKNLSESMDHINRNNLDERVELPSKKDEIYNLSFNFNRLLDRIEKALIRERQFTADASHQLRTPLAVLKGTLEVLIRRGRDQKEYEEKISFCIHEIDRMSKSAEQLLTIARIDNYQVNTKQESEAINSLISAILFRLKDEINQHNIKINVSYQLEEPYQVDAYYSDLILENFISNAIKYSYNGAEINIIIKRTKGGIACSVCDTGIGIIETELEKIFDNFYRSDAVNHGIIKGNGLGLAIARKAADSIGAELKVESTINKGSCFTLFYPPIS
jgi:two-component system heavy metal sensor histidine kinase CusS